MNMKIFYQRIAFIILLVISILSFSFNSDQSKDICGVWEYYQGYFLHTLKINKDSTYNYSYSGDMIKRENSGTWKLNNDSLILNSCRQKPIVPSIVSKYNSAINGCIFTFKSESTFVETVFLKLYAKDLIIDSLFISDFGKVHIETDRMFDSIQISSLEFKNLNAKLDTLQNMFLVELTPIVDSYIYQENEVWILKENMLFHPNSDLDNEIYGDSNRINYFSKR